MNEYILQIAEKALEASRTLRQLKSTQKNAALLRLAELLDKNRRDLQAENARDLAYAREAGLDAALVDRLTLSDKVIDAMCRAVREIAAFPDPVGEVVEGRTLASGIRLLKVRAPLGVIAVIYESRPNVTIDVGALCLKSGNAVILRGGKEALHSNKALVALFREALAAEKIPQDAVQLVERTDRALIVDLVRCERQIDLVVPRGGEALIRYVTEHSLIPVVKHDKGVCNIYVAADAPWEMARSVVLNAKIQRPGVCNAVECLLIDRAWPHAQSLLLALREQGVILHSDEDGIGWGKSLGVEIQPFLNEHGFGHEYLSLNLSVRPVSGIEQAIDHIHTWGSKHSDAILTNDYTLAQRFADALDSAAVFINCSTRFHDGGEFGLGAEVGIATGKLHVRGPMGLRDLTTTRYIATGHGEIRT
ncbi:MAG: glutamate-5-semialdehyde dehydrogenase [Turneriella sp.]|nr:glutamate-5-semialdehyde dehydrogenase [Leptospiraceae bacterium]MCX7633291.1 glutamate-5-semialdehyde dehydrogenase [Turneriella sp.]